MPANYDLPENGVVKRVRYFDGLFLKDQDFIDDQKYHTDRQRRPNLLLRVAGICDGLAVLVENNQVKVTQGSALDNHGRLIVLSETLSIDLKGQAGELDIYISYQEEASDITQANNDKSAAGANTKGAKGSTRWWENPRIEAVLKTAKPTAEDTIWLGRVTVSGTTVQGNPNLEFRQYSGVYLPSSASSKNGPTLRSGGNVNPTLAVLTGDLSVTGNVGIGTATVSNPQGWNKVLEIFGTTNARLNVRSSGEVITSVFSHDNWNGARGLIGTVSNHALTFVTNYTHQMTIDGVGKVGIGTTSPAAKLSINGGLHVGGDSDPGDNNLLVDGNSTISGALSVTSTSTFTGNVGIGATSPGQTLTVKGTHNSGKHEGSGMTSGGNLAIVSNAPQIDFIDTDHNDWSIHVNSNKMYFIRQPWEFKDLVLDGAGNVGIGTDTPAAKLAINGGLHVGGDSDPGDNNLLVDGNSTISGALNFGSTIRQMISLWGSSNYGIGVQNNTQYFRTDKNFAWYKGGSHINDELGAGTSGTVQMVIKDGNVGIGTTEPGIYKLNVQGNQCINSDLTIRGKIQSGMWRVTHVFDRKAGPLPITADFTTGGGTLVVLFTGTAFRANAGFINLVMLIDNQESMYVDLYTNEGNTHKTLPLQFSILSGISAGKHTLKIDKWGTSTLSDANDRFYAMVLELPF